MVVAAVALGLVMGVVIGGLGGGGGVLTVPALVYALGQSAHDATTSSVIIVGTTAVVGAVVRARSVDWRTAVAFGLVGIPTAYLGTVLNHRVSQPALLLAFAALTVIAALAMLGGEREPEAGEAPTGVARTGGATGARSVLAEHYPLSGSRITPMTAVKVVACGAAVGFLTGFLGVGGGFLVVPALVIALRMPMTTAIGTSLLIIVFNSVSSIAARLGDLQMDGNVVVAFTVAAVLGTLMGKLVADRLSGAALTRSFAVLLLLVGMFVGAQSVVAL